MFSLAASLSHWWRWWRYTIVTVLTTQLSMFILWWVWWWEDCDQTKASLQLSTGGLLVAWPGQACPSSLTALCHGGHHHHHHHHQPPEPEEQWGRSQRHTGATLQPSAAQADGVQDTMQHVPALAFLYRMYNKQLPCLL